MIAPTLALEVAGNIDPFQRALDLAPSPKDKRNFRRIAGRPEAVKANRHRVVRGLTSLDAKSEPLQVKIQGKLNPLSPARGHRIPLIAFLAHNLGYPYKSLPSDLTNGVKITGATTPSRALALLITPETRQLPALRSCLRVRNNRVTRSLVGPEKPLLRAKCWELSHRAR